MKNDQKKEKGGVDPEAPPIPCRGNDRASKLEKFYDRDCSQWQIIDNDRVIATGIESESDCDRLLGNPTTKEPAQ